MTTLCIDDTPLAVQAEVARASAEAFDHWLNAFSSVSWQPPAPSPLGSVEARAVLLAPCALCVGDCHTYSSSAGDAAMMKKQVHEHPPLQVCHPGHRPIMWRAAGNCQVAHYVECAACGVRTERFAGEHGAKEAAHAWAQRQVQPIPRRAAA